MLYFVGEEVVIELVYDGIFFYFFKNGKICYLVKNLLTSTQGCCEL